MEQKKNKKIAFISTLSSSSWGGSEELWNLAANTAIENGDEIGIFIYNWDKLPKQIETLKSKGAKIFKRRKKTSLFKRLLSKLCNKFGLYHPFFLNPYKPLIKFNPDSVVITDGRTYYTANDIWLKKILTTYFAEKYTIIAQSNNHYHFPNNRENTISLFRKAKNMVFVSHRNKEECFHQLGYNLNNTVIIQNPINIKKIEPLPIPAFPNNEIHMAVIGRLSVVDKGQDMLVKIMSNTFWKNSNVYLHFYGKGSDENYLNKLIGYYGVEKKVFIEGYQDIKSIYKKCHCLLMPSLQEGTSLAMLEAMALGRVCIMSDVGGAKEWIENNINGFIIDAPTEILIDKTMKKALENLNNWEEIGKKAHQRIISNFEKFPGKNLYNII